MLWFSPRLEAACWLEACSAVESGSQPSAQSDVPKITLHGLRHSFVAILVAAGCNVREVSEWADHNSAAFTSPATAVCFEDGSDAAVDRLDCPARSRYRLPEGTLSRQHQNRSESPKSPRIDSDYLRAQARMPAQAHQA